MTIACNDIAELLPFFLNGTLGAEEEDVRLHLAACRRCRQELAEVQQAWLVFESHIPSMILAQYVQRTEMEFGDREWIESHLDHCSSCSELAGLAEMDRLSDEPYSDLTEVVSPRNRRWSMAVGEIAAGIAVVAAVVWLVGDPNGGEQSQTTVELVSVGSAVEAESASSSEIPFLDGFESGTTLAWSLEQDREEESSALDL